VKVPGCSSWLCACVIVMVASCGMVFQAHADEPAQDVAQARGRKQSFSDRIAPVTHRVFSKVGRFELAPRVEWIVNDPFYTHLTAGGTVSYHIFDSLSVGVSGEYYASVEAGPPVLPGKPPEVDFARPSYASWVQIGWAPVYGKLSVLAESFLHFDTYIQVGGGVVGQPGEVAPMATVAIGQRYSLTPSIALQIEARERVFTMDRVSDCRECSSLQSWLGVSMSLCFYVPGAPDRSPAWR